MPSLEASDHQKIQAALGSLAVHLLVLFTSLSFSHFSVFPCESSPNKKIRIVIF
jgi:hypothetical protein